MVTKITPEISYIDFLLLINKISTFKSKTGNIYINVSLDGSVLTFIRKSTNTKWQMDLKDVYQAYIELTDFKTTNFKPYVPRRQSPALGLLLSLELLKNKKN